MLHSIVVLIRMQEVVIWARYYFITSFTIDSMHATSLALAARLRRLCLLYISCKQQQIFNIFLRYSYFFIDTPFLTPMQNYKSSSYQFLNIPNKQTNKLTNKKPSILVYKITCQLLQYNPSKYSSCYNICTRSQ